MTLVLIGGGWSDPQPVYAPFLQATGPRPRIACVVVDEGDGVEQAERWQSVLRELTPCDPRAVLVPLGDQLDLDDLSEVDGVLVCGGLTPAYAAALAPCAGRLRTLVSEGLPYAGFSAGAAVAAGAALVGGYRIGSRTVCPEDAGEDLVDLTVMQGLGLVDLTLDVHAAQWGTLGRLVAAVENGLVPAGLAIDEDTALVVDADDVSIVGAGAAHAVVPAPEGVVLHSVAAGTPIPRAIVDAARQR